MTQAELNYLETVPYELTSIKDELARANKIAALKLSLEIENLLGADRKKKYLEQLEAIMNG